MTTILSIERALISVFDKGLLEKLALFLKEQNILVLSTGGTASFLREIGVNVTDISMLSQFPEILNGRVKTLSPKIHGGILFDRNKPEHERTLKELDIPPIDLVVSNLYPFSSIASDDSATLDQLVENIDIGGPAMLRAAAKNHQHVTVLSSPSQYLDFIVHYRKNNGTTLAYRQSRALDAFNLTYGYDRNIAQILDRRFSAQPTKDALDIELTDGKPLRYGENPHQTARVYSRKDCSDIKLSSIEPLAGKHLSYNNLLDANAAILALRLLGRDKKDHDNHAIIIKHGVPCGAARSHHLAKAIAMALSSDEKSAFGGIVAVDNSFDEKCVSMIQATFLEMIIAPSFTEEAINALKSRRNLRLLSIANLMNAQIEKQSYRSILGGMLVQERDDAPDDMTSWETVTNRKPDQIEMMAMDFAFRIARATPSNAIAIASHEHLFGIGAGQPNRVQSLEIAVMGARTRGFTLDGAAIASDAFFPFQDSISLARKNGIDLIVQPGGSIRDRKVIEMADELGMCMVFTNRRHFLH